MKPDSYQLITDANVAMLEKVTAFIDGILEEHDCPMRVQMQISIAVEEIFVNIASYAYPSGGGSAEVDVSVFDGAIEIKFIDGGTPYDPLAKTDPDVTLGADDRPIGGLGIFIVKKQMDEVRYEYKDGKNVLTIKKRLSL